MGSRKYTSGYCPICHKNVPHRRWIENPFLLLADLATFGTIGWLRLGPWLCVHCDNKVSVLPLRRKAAMDYRSAALGDETIPVRPRKQIKTAGLSGAQSLSPNSESPVVSAPAAAEPIASPGFGSSKADLEPAESVGNFIKTESSLLLKSKRMQRYSEKYRDAVVRRILSNATSIKQVREEKQLSESEITDWIADLFERQEQKIEALENLRNPNSQDDFIGKSIQGQVRPR